MGYTTEFYGEIFISPPLNKETIEYINKFSNTRRMKRNELILMRKYGGKFGFDYSYGIDGEFFIGDIEDDTILDYNYPPSTQPSLWCNWIINSKGNIEFNGSEKFYYGDTWMKYIIDNFIASQGHVCNGSINAFGEDSEDKWILKVENNVVSSIELALLNKRAIDIINEELQDMPKIREKLIERLLVHP